MPSSALYFAIVRRAMVFLRSTTMSSSLSGRDLSSVEMISAI